jgi:hypothetical protein
MRGIDAGFISTGSTSAADALFAANAMAAVATIIDGEKMMLNFMLESF